MFTIFYRRVHSYGLMTLIAVILLLIVLFLAYFRTQTEALSPNIVTPPSGMPHAMAVYGQPDFKTGSTYATGPDTLKNASSVAADQHGGLYIVDYGNSRVLHFPAQPARTAGFQPDRVYGQPDYFANRPAAGVAGLNYPHGIAVADNGDIYVADMFNNRVLHYPATSTSADQVYGQPNFIITLMNSTGVSAGSMNHPQGLAIDKTGLYVADSANNRVLHYPFGSTIADFVYGQGLPGNAPNNFTTSQNNSGTMGLNNPRDVAVDHTGIYVADTGSNRIVHYPFGVPSADFVYGQPDFSPAATQVNQGLPHPNETTLNNPTKVTLDQFSGLYVADRANNRVIYYPPAGGQRQNGTAAVRLYGQKDYTTTDIAITADMFHGPGAVAVDMMGEVFVLDIYNQRVLTFVTALHIVSQPAGTITKGKAFGLSVALQDVGSHTVFADYTDLVSVWMKPGTFPAGALLGGMTRIKAIQGVAIFSALVINSAGVGYILTVGSPGYVPVDTSAFAVTLPPHIA